MAKARASHPLRATVYSQGSALVNRQHTKDFSESVALRSGRCLCMSQRATTTALCKRSATRRASYGRLCSWPLLRSSSASVGCCAALQVTPR